MLSADDVSLVAALHGGFPLSDRPYADAAARLGYSEDMLIERLQHLLSHGDLTRFGPLFQIERAGGRFELAAMAVPEPRFDAVAQLLREMPEVAHNYRRESALTTHDAPDDESRIRARGRAPTGLGSLWEAAPAAEGCSFTVPPHEAHGTDAPLNMWFVIAVGSPAEVPQVVARIEQASGLNVLRLPKEKEYFVELRLPLMEPPHASA